MTSEIELIVQAAGKLLEAGVLGATAIVALAFAWHKDKQATQLARDKVKLVEEKAELILTMNDARISSEHVLYDRLLQSTAEQNARYREVVSELNQTAIALADREAAEVVAYSTPPESNTDPPAGYLGPGGRHGGG